MKKIRPNKKTWIYGASYRGKRKPYFPPIIPHIPPGLRDDLVGFLTNQVVLRQADDLKRLKELEGHLASFEGRDPESLTTVTRRTLAAERREAERLRSRLEQEKSRIERRAHNDVMNFSLLRGVREIRLERREMMDDQVHPAIVLNTAPIKIGATILGTYDVFFTPRFKVPYHAFDVQRRDRQYPRGPHPHYGTGGPCYGTFGPAMAKALEANRFQLLFGLFLNYLAIYDAGSPLIVMSAFRPHDYRRRMYVNEDPLA